MREDLFDPVVLFRDHIDVVSAEHAELHHLLQDIRRQLGHRMTDDAIQSRLNRAGRNFEWLKEVGTNPDCDDDRHQNDFDILPPMRFPRHRGQLVQFAVERFRFGFDPVGLPFA